MTRASTAVLSIGSNLGDRMAQLQIAVDTVRPWLVAVSPVYETDPWGGVEQDDFLNAVLIVTDAGADPRRWLVRAHDAERAAGRVRDVRWGPRSLDVDVICVRDSSGHEVTSDDPELILPHPRAGERAFVLVPWLDADPAARLAGTAVADLLMTLDTTTVRARPDLVLS